MVRPLLPVCLTVSVLFAETASAWSPESNLTSGFADSLAAPRIRIGPTGRLHCVHHSKSTSSDQLHLYYRYWTGTSWTEPQGLPGPDYKTSESDLAIGANEYVHVVGNYRPDGTINTPYTIYYWGFDGTTWSGPVQLSPGTGGDSNNCLSPSIAIDRNGDLHVVWAQDGMTGGEGDIMYRKRHNGVWLPTQNVTANLPGTSYGSQDPDLAVDQSGSTVHIVWHDDFLNNGFQAYYTKNTNLGDAGAWIPSSQWFLLSTGNYGKSQTIILDRNDRPNVWWLDKFGSGTNVMGYRRWTGSAWTSPANWGTIWVRDGFFDAGNLLRYVYIDMTNSTGQELYYRTYDYTSFSNAELVSTGPDTMKVDQVSMTADSWGIPQVIWEERKNVGDGVGPAYIYYSRRSDPPSGTIAGTVRDQYGTAVISAVITANPGSYSVTTGGSGTYSITNVTVGAYQVIAARAGYLSETRAEVVVSENQATACDFVIMRLIPGDFDHDGDVDQFDFGHFQACMTGPGVPQEETSCADARLDADLDVDQDDFGVFLRCMSGASRLADPHCTD